MRKESFHVENAMLNATIEWKQAVLAEGWRLVGPRVRIRRVPFDVAWNLMTMNPQ